MLVVLQAISDGAPGHRVQLRSDQVLRVGRSGWADFCVEGDAALMDVHFEVCCAPEGCIIRALNADSPTMVNGEPVASVMAYDGDEILAGATRFRLMIEGGPARDAPEEPAPEPKADPAPAPATAVAAGAALGLVGLCAYLEFGEDIKPLADAAATEDELIDELASQEKYQDALRLRAYVLEKPLAVWWGCHCLREEVGEPLPPLQALAVDAAADWAADPSDARRRAAEAKAAEAKYSGPGATLGLAAFWSGGSLAPEGSPDVEADERLTSQGVASALVAAAYVGDPTKAPERFQAFLHRGKEVAEGKLRPTPPS